MVTVWVIESGEYEDRGVDGVAETLEAAVAYVKGRCPPTDIVNWDDLVDTSWEHDGVTHPRYKLVGDVQRALDDRGKYRRAIEISSMELIS